MLAAGRQPRTSTQLVPEYPQVVTLPLLLSVLVWLNRGRCPDALQPTVPGNAKLLNVVPTEWGESGTRQKQPLARGGVVKKGDRHRRIETLLSSSVVGKIVNAVPWAYKEFIKEAVQIEHLLTRMSVQ